MAFVQDAELGRARRGMDPPRLARLTGALYLTIAVCGMFAPLVLERLLVPGDAAATAGNILGSRGVFAASLIAWLAIVVADVAVAVTASLLLASAGRILAPLAAAVRVVYAAMLAALLVAPFDAYRLLVASAAADVARRQVAALAALESFSAGFVVALVIFGVHLILLGALIARSRAIPRALGFLLVAAGVGYIADSLAKVFVAGHGGPASALLLAPAILGELGLTFWLLVKGVKADAIPGGGGRSSRPAIGDRQLGHSTTGGTQ